MSDYTPKTEEILNCYIDSVESHVEPTNREELVSEFNRWFASEIEKAEQRGFDRGVEETSWEFAGEDL